MVLNLEVGQQEISWITAVGLNAPHLGCSQHDHIRTLVLEPSFHRRRILEVEGGPIQQQLLVITRALQSAGDGTSGHAPMPRDKDTVLAGNQHAHQAFGPLLAATAEGLVGGFSIEPTT